MRRYASGVLSAGVFLVPFLSLLFESKPARANDCSWTQACSQHPSYCDPATHRVKCNQNPGDFQVSLFQDEGYKGPCITFEVAQTTGSFLVNNLGDYGFNDCISSLKVGKQVRLHAYRDADYDGGLSRQEVMYWTATYEPGPQYNIGRDFWSKDVVPPQPLGAVHDDLSSLVIENRSFLKNNEPIPYQYRGDYPSDAETWWSNETQGLCHTKDYWFLAQEISMPDDFGYWNPIVPCPACASSYVPMSDDYTLCMCGNPAHVSPAHSCVLNSTNELYTGRIWRVPLETDLNSSGQGAKHKDLPDFQGKAPSTMEGYRHFGDPDCLTIAGKDYVFIPVQACSQGPNLQPPPRVILVLDSELEFVASWTLPAPPAVDPGIAGWVALKPGIDGAPEVWVSGDINNGKGLLKFRGAVDASLRPVTQTLTFQGDASALLVTTLFGLPVHLPTVSGGVFSPSGKTLYLTNGNMGGYGGVHAIDVASGTILADSSMLTHGPCYGPFCYGIPSDPLWFNDEEPEGMDFFDTRCSEKIIPGITKERESQLHSILLNNNAFHDAVRLKHYSVNGWSNSLGTWGETGRPFMCHNPADLSQGTILGTTQRYPTDFSVFTPGSVKNLQHVAGPVAAGGTATLSSFSLNWGSGEPVGLVLSGNFDVSNGTVYGATYLGYGPDNNHVLAKTVTSNSSLSVGYFPIEFSNAQSKLVALSDSLSSLLPRSTTVPTPSGVRFVVDNPELSVFRVSGSVLGRATTIEFALGDPSYAQATILINVFPDGDPVTIQNAGITLNGIDPGKILWNFNGALHLNMSSVPFPGSALAPLADAYLRWGTFSGTLIAKSVDAFVEFYWAPFRGNLRLPNSY